MNFPETISVDDISAMVRSIRLSLLLRGRPPLEGSTSPEELLYLATTARNSGARVIGEIGFNAGFSAQTFLRAVPEARVVSFDLVEHGYTKVAKKMVDAKFPGRHTLIAGDSTKTVPEYAAANPDLRFDVAFIDGGHDYQVAKADIVNMMSMCTEKTAVIIDDLTPWLKWGKGPTQAWNEGIEAGYIRQNEVFQDGRKVDVQQAPGKRVWALGNYVYK
ncbi:class I SAM-dependent methyltransferase [Mycolicibacterium sp.]|uniref:class I SAM-dependent methyltransferase n=1 Tax=Mycolicibacterium sp. TaxID=2320850 RepID=UPI0025DD6B8A|nr:class I SAM-dependent methyltransferase [Mycolicibacterium sp.]